ncbi:MAG: hypothetical protein SCH12_05080 [Nitrosomonadaceae bacterium]|nr:hypothetical protein [Nitrosomonadaceae bacterium]
MKKIISCFAVISCFVLGTTFSYAHNYEHHGKDHHGKDHHGQDHHGQDHHGWMKEMFAGIDTNSDGMIGFKEFYEFHSNKFKELDTNSDEKISLEEMQTGWEKMHSVKHKKMD